MDNNIKDIRPEMFRYIKEQRAVSVEEIAKTLRLKEYQVNDILHLSNIYERLKQSGGQSKDLITIKGIGIERCVVCSGKNDDHSVIMRVPSTYFTTFRPVKKLSEGVRGHRNCYSDIGLLFNVEGLSCFTCDNWYTEFSDEEPVREGCHKFHTSKKVVGEPGSYEACNFYSPDSAVKLSGFNGYKISRGVWGKAQSQVTEKTQEGYKKLVAILEKARLVEEIRIETSTDKHKLSNDMLSTLDLSILD